MIVAQLRAAASCRYLCKIHTWKTWLNRKHASIIRTNWPNQAPEGRRNHNARALLPLHLLAVVTTRSLLALSQNPIRTDRTALVGWKTTEL